MIRRPPSSPLSPYPALSLSFAQAFLTARHFGRQLGHRDRVEVAATRHVVNMTLAPGRRRDRSSRSETDPDRKSTRLNSSHQIISYAVFCLKKKKTHYTVTDQ